MFEQVLINFNFVNTEHSLLVEAKKRCYPIDSIKSKSHTSDNFMDLSETSSDRFLPIRLNENSVEMLKIKSLRTHAFSKTTKVKTTSAFYEKRTTAAKTKRPTTTSTASTKTYADISSTSSTTTLISSTSTTSSSTTPITLNPLAKDLQFQDIVSSTLLSAAPNLTHSQIQDLINAFANFMTLLLPIMTNEETAQVIPFLGYLAGVHILEDTVPFSPEVRDNMTQTIFTMAPNTTPNQINSIIDACDSIIIFIYRYLTKEEIPVMIPRMAQSLIDYAKYVDGVTTTTTFMSTSTSETSTFSTTTTNPLATNQQFQQLLTSTLISINSNLTQSELQNLGNAFTNLMSLITTSFTSDQSALLIPLLGQKSKEAMLNNSVPFTQEIRESLSRTIFAIVPDTPPTLISSIIDATDAINTLVASYFNSDEIIQLVPVMVEGLVDFTETLVSTTTATMSSPSTPSTTTSSSTTTTATLSTMTVPQGIISEPDFIASFVNILQGYAPDLSATAQNKFTSGFEVLAYYTQNLTSSQSAILAVYVRDEIISTYLANTPIYSSELIQNITNKILEVNPNAPESQIDAIIYVMQDATQNCLSYLNEIQTRGFIGGASELFVDFKNRIESSTTTATSSTTTTSVILSTLTLLQGTTTEPVFESQFNDILEQYGSDLSQIAKQKFINGFKLFDYYTQSFNSSQAVILAEFIVNKIIEMYLASTFPYDSLAKQTITNKILEVDKNTPQNQIDGIIYAMEDATSNCLSYINETQTRGFITDCGQLFISNKINIEASNSTTSTITTSTLTTSTSTASTTTLTMTTLATTTLLPPPYPLTSAQVTQFINQMIVNGLNQSHAQQLVDPLERLMASISTQPDDKITSFQPAFPWILPTLIAQVSGNPDKALNSIQRDSLNTTMILYFPEMNQPQLAYSMTAQEDMAFILRDNYWISGPIAIAMANFFTPILIASN